MASAPQRSCWKESIRNCWDKGSGEWGDFPFSILHLSFVMDGTEHRVAMANDKCNPENVKSPHSPLPIPHSSSGSLLSNSDRASTSSIQVQRRLYPRSCGRHFHTRCI